MSTLLAFAESLENSPLGIAIAEGRYAFPIIEGTHLIGLSAAVGLIMLVDLRLIGVFLEEIPVRELHAQLRPYVLGGFAVVILAGCLLLTSEATTVIVSPPWPFKAFFFLLGGANALYFEFVIARRPQALPDRGPLPRGVRRAGTASLLLWTLVIICGRLIPYITKWT